MKSISMPKTEQLIEKTKQQLPKVEKEKLTTTTKVNNSKTKFTAVDMWNRNRKSRSASDMMRKWNLN